MKNSNLFQMDSGENDFAQACAEWYSQGESQRNSGARNWKADTKLCFALEGLSCTLFCMPFTQMLFLQGGQFGSLQVVYGGSELDWRNLWRWDMEEILGWAFEIIDKGRRQRNPKKSSWIPDSKLVQDGAKTTVRFSSVQSLSRVWLFVTPWIARSTPGLPVHHQLPESTQTHAHRVGDTIQPSHPPSSPSPPAPNPCQHQGLFQWVSSSHEVAKVLEFQLQHQSFQWTPRTDFL